MLVFPNIALVVKSTESTLSEHTCAQHMFFASDGSGRAKQLLFLAEDFLVVGHGEGLTNHRLFGPFSLLVVLFLGSLVEAVAVHLRGDSYSTRVIAP